MANDSINEGVGITLLDGQEIDFRDQKAREVATAAAAQAERTRQQGIDAYGGRNLLELFADEIEKLPTHWHWVHNRIENDNLDGIMIGDYIPDELVNGEPFEAVLGNVNGYKYCGDTATPNSWGFIFRDPIKVTDGYATNGNHILWNKTNTNQGTAAQKCPYLASNLREWEKDVLWPLMPEALRQFMVAPRLLLEERYSASGELNDSAGWSWQTVEGPFSLSEYEVYGAAVWGTHGYSVGIPEQWQIFKQAKDIVAFVDGSRAHWWLRSPQGGSSVYVCIVTSDGHASGTYATHTYLFPRCGFLVG